MKTADVMELSPERRGGRATRSTPGEPQKTKPEPVAVSRRQAQTEANRVSSKFTIPKDSDSYRLTVGGHEVELTNLRKVFWPALGTTKRDLLQYYADISPLLIPHLRQRAMVMKRYPDGIRGEFFFMKRAPSFRPSDIQICPIEHASGSVIGFPIVEDLGSLLWIVNLGCIDLNPWYARCDDVHRPDYLHFDLDPTPGAGFPHVREAALRVHEALEALKIPNYAKTSGSRGIHVYVPIVRGPIQKEVWSFAKQLAEGLAALHPNLITSQYRISRRPEKHVLVDYNQNAWGRTLASIYSVRPTERATVSTPVEWDEIARGIETEEFRMDNIRPRLRRLGDLWKPLLSEKKRFRLQRML